MIQRTISAIHSAVICIVFAGLHHDRAVTQPLGLTRAVQNLFSRHAIARQSLIRLPQPAIHALPHAMTRYLDQAPQMHRIANTLLAHRVGPSVQLLQSDGPAFAQPFEQLGFVSALSRLIDQTHALLVMLGRRM